MPEISEIDWDAFLSYASEDKIGFVKPLADRLHWEGMKVWFDEFEIRYGDSITQSIERGLANSRLGIIVISQNSLKKNWTKYEISTLKSLFINYGTRLIPIWKDIDAATIKLTDPGLLDLRAIDSKGRTIEEIAYEILAVARPDILSRINYKLRTKALNAAAPILEIDLKQIAPGPRQREKLSARDLSRIHLLHGVFFDVFKDSVEDWIDNFCRDVDYENEILFWEMVGAFYLSWTRTRKYSRGEKKLILSILMQLVQRCRSEELETLLDKTPEHVRSPFEKKVDEWNASLRLIEAYTLEDLANHPNIQMLFASRLNQPD